MVTILPQFLYESYNFVKVLGNNMPEKQQNNQYIDGDALPFTKPI